MNFIFLGAQEQEVWKSFIPAIGTIVAALITTIGVIWTARSSLKKLKIDQKATPTELTRYKEWLEVAEKYKNVYIEKYPGGPDYGGQWNNIKKSCEASLQAASWERIVLAETPMGLAQKQLLNLDSAYAASKILVKTNNENTHPVEVPSFQGKVYNTRAIIVWITTVLFFSLFLYLLCIGHWVLGIIFLIPYGIFWTILTSYAYSALETPKVYFRKIAIAKGVNIQESGKVDRLFRIRASLFGDLSNDICLPFEGRGFLGFVCHFLISLPLVISRISCSEKYNFGYMKEELKNTESEKRN